MIVTDNKTISYANNIIKISMSFGENWRPCVPCEIISWASSLINSENSVGLAKHPCMRSCKHVKYSVFSLPHLTQACTVRYIHFSIRSILSRTPVLKSTDHNRDDALSRMPCKNLCMPHEFCHHNSYFFLYTSIQCEYVVHCRLLRSKTSLDVIYYVVWFCPGSKASVHDIGKDLAQYIKQRNASVVVNVININFLVERNYHGLCPFCWV